MKHKLSKAIAIGSPLIMRAAILVVQYLAEPAYNDLDDFAKVGLTTLASFPFLAEQLKIRGVKRISRWLILTAEVAAFAKQVRMRGNSRIHGLWLKETPGQF